MLLEDVKYQSNTEIGELLEFGTKVSSEVKEDKIISVFYFQGRFEKVVYNCTTNIVELVKKETRINKQGNIFFEKAAYSQLVA